MNIELIDNNYFSQLRDCFYAGYSLPKFCIDNQISNPLIVSPYPQTLWEIYVQFSYDKRINADYCLVQTDDLNINASVACVLSDVPLKKFSPDEFEFHDKIFMMTVLRLNQFDDKIFYLDQIFETFKHIVYAEIPLLNFQTQHPNVKIVVNNHPYIHLNEHSTDYEKAISKSSIHDLREKLKLKKAEYIFNRFDFLGYSNDEVLHMLEMTGAITNPDGSTDFIDDDYPLVNIKNGLRQTAYKPNDFQNTIYFMGTCSFVGIGAPFDKTVESYLQLKLNQGGFKYRVVNASQYYAGRYQDIFYNLNKLPVVDGDIICILIQDLRPRYFPFLDLTHIFDRPHNFGEVFSDSAHLNEHGYQLLAEYYYQFFTQTNFMENYPSIPKYQSTFKIYGVPNPLSIQSAQSNLDSKLKQSLSEYKSSLKKYRLNIGCIVMNCNPFTLGHRYLIEYAKSKCQLLYIFVVEEDKSEFPFADRFKLVKEGCKDIPNVIVIPSGKFIISSLTFEGYFNKSKLQNQTVDSTFDVELFATEIAPSLGINIRFAGEEPNDTVTRQYNETMKLILPQHNIRFIEIPRKTFDGEVISAKRVRTLLREGDFDSLKNLVPQSTLNYLQDKFIPIPPPLR